MTILIDTLRFLLKELFVSKNTIMSSKINLKVDCRHEVYSLTLSEKNDNFV